MKQRLWICIILLASPRVLVPQAVRPASQVEWPYYGGDPGGSRYSPLADINTQNIQRLQPVWQWKHWETRLAEYGTAPGFFENTPLMIDGVLYVTTPYNSIAAIDAETGKELWKWQLPASGNATPMTYRLGATGKQYLVIAAGGHPKITEESLGDALLAFTLP